LRQKALFNGLVRSQDWVPHQAHQKFNLSKNFARTFQLQYFLLHFAVHYFAKFYLHPPGKKETNQSAAQKESFKLTISLFVKTTVFAYEKIDASSGALK